MILQGLIKDGCVICFLPSKSNNIKYMCAFEAGYSSEVIYLPHLKIPSKSGDMYFSFCAVFTLLQSIRNEITHALNVPIGKLIVMRLKGFARYRVQ